MKKRIVFLIVFLFLVFFTACKKDTDDGDNGGDKTVPALTTTAISEITSTSAKSGGIITTDGGSSVSQHGVCIGTAINPSLTDTYTSDGSGSGTFVSSITGLLPNTDYYVRAYATNETGTGYGSSVQFKTSPALLEGTYTDQDRSWCYFKVVDSGNSIQYYSISDEPWYYTAYENRGKLTSNPATGDIVVGDWYQFISGSGTSFLVVQQKDNSTLIVRWSIYNYSDAYFNGNSRTYVK